MIALPKVSVIWCWYDLWVGAYWDSPRRTLYLFPVPTLGVKIVWTRVRGAV